ncbi:MAG TPA: hypothetical protein VFC92_02845 [Bacteroidales bacterium]|nr:hypothetical protein [Bacteroidales bacterium]
MKKVTLIITAILISAASYAGGNKYQEKMGETLAGFSQVESVADYQSLANKFMMIAQAEKTEWLPYYYHAQCYILMSFSENENPEKKDEYLDVAETSVAKMLELAPSESEVYVMQGMLYTARLVVDPMSRGQKYGALSAQSIGKALGIEPENPRARYMQIANEMGTASYFGSDVSVPCQKARVLYDGWDNYQLKSPIHPRWGKGQLVDTMEQCGER